MKNTGTLDVVTRGDREIVMTRLFDAPRALVFRALTEPALLKRWFGPHGWTLVECEVDLRVGGAWRYLSRDEGGRTMGMRGTYREIAAPQRIVHTEAFDDYAQHGEAVVTTTLAERDGRTTLTVVVLSPSREVRDAVVASGMEHGAAETYDRLAALVEHDAKTIA
jgi:uncharacterized protein YndB with AHSA1/START domain